MTTLLLLPALAALPLAWLAIRRILAREREAAQRYEAALDEAAAVVLVLQSRLRQLARPDRPQCARERKERPSLARPL